MQDRWNELNKIRYSVIKCHKCPLCKASHSVVFGEGNPYADIMLVGEAPGEWEDLTGSPFIGRAGVLLTEILNGAGLRRNDVYIANVVKCRPPSNRKPEPEEIAACIDSLTEQVKIVQPHLIVALGSTATIAITEKYEVETDGTISKLRGKLFDVSVDSFDTKLLPTFHPSYILRKPSARELIDADFEIVRRFLDGEVELI